MILSTLLIYIRLPSSLKKLPRDVNKPAIVLALVYGSEKLKAWVKERDEQGLMDKNSPNEKGQYRSVDDTIRLDSFVDSKGIQR